MPKVRTSWEPPIAPSSCSTDYCPHAIYSSKYSLFDYPSIDGDSSASPNARLGAGLDPNSPFFPALITDLNEVHAGGWGVFDNGGNSFVWSLNQEDGAQDETFLFRNPIPFGAKIVGIEVQLRVSNFIYDEVDNIDTRSGTAGMFHFADPLTHTDPSDEIAKPIKITLGKMDFSNVDIAGNTGGIVDWGKSEYSFAGTSANAEVNTDYNSNWLVFPGGISSNVNFPPNSLSPNPSDGALTTYSWPSYNTYVLGSSLSTWDLEFNQWYDGATGLCHDEAQADLTSSYPSVQECEAEGHVWTPYADDAGWIALNLQTSFNDVHGSPIALPEVDFGGLQVRFTYVPQGYRLKKHVVTTGHLDKDRSGEMSMRLPFRGNSIDLDLGVQPDWAGNLGNDWDGGPYSDALQASTLSELADEVHLHSIPQEWYLNKEYAMCEDSTCVNVSARVSNDEALLSDGHSAYHTASRSYLSGWGIHSSRFPTFENNDMDQPLEGGIGWMLQFNKSQHGDAGTWSDWFWNLNGDHMEACYSRTIAIANGECVGEPGAETLEDCELLGFTWIKGSGWLVPGGAEWSWAYSDTFINCAAMGGNWIYSWSPPYCYLDTKESCEETSASMGFLDDGEWLPGGAASPDVFINGLGQEQEIALFGHMPSMRAANSFREYHGDAYKTSSWIPDIRWSYSGGKCWHDGGYEIEFINKKKVGWADCFDEDATWIPGKLERTTGPVNALLWDTIRGHGAWTVTNSSSSFVREHSDCDVLTMNDAYDPISNCGPYTTTTDYTFCLGANSSTAEGAWGGFHVATLDGFVEAAECEAAGGLFYQTATNLPIIEDSKIALSYNLRQASEYGIIPETYKNADDPDHPYPLLGASLELFTESHPSSPEAGSKEEDNEAEFLPYSRLFRVLGGTWDTEIGTPITPNSNLSKYFGRMFLNDNNSASNIHPFSAEDVLGIDNGVREGWTANNVRLLFSTLSREDQEVLRNRFFDYEGYESYYEIPDDATRYTVTMNGQWGSFTAVGAAVPGFIEQPITWTLLDKLEEKFAAATSRNLDSTEGGLSLALLSQLTLDNVTLPFNQVDGAGISKAAVDGGFETVASPKPSLENFEVADKRAGLLLAECKLNLYSIELVEEDGERKLGEIMDVKDIPEGVEGIEITDEEYIGIFTYNTRSLDFALPVLQEGQYVASKYLGSGQATPSFAHSESLADIDFLWLHPNSNNVGIPVTSILKTIKTGDHVIISNPNDPALGYAEYQIFNKGCGWSFGHCDADPQGTSDPEGFGAEDWTTISENCCVGGSNTWYPFEDLSMRGSDGDFMFLQFVESKELCEGTLDSPFDNSAWPAGFDSLYGMEFNAEACAAATLVWCSETGDDGTWSTTTYEDCSGSPAIPDESIFVENASFEDNSDSGDVNANDPFEWWLENSHIPGLVKRSWIDEGGTAYSGDFSLLFKNGVTTSSNGYRRIKSAYNFTNDFIDGRTYTFSVKLKWRDSALGEGPPSASSFNRYPQWWFHGVGGIKYGPDEWSCEGSTCSDYPDAFTEDTWMDHSKTIIWDNAGAGHNQIQLIVVGRGPDYFIDDFTITLHGSEGSAGGIVRFPGTFDNNHWSDHYPKYFGGEYWPGSLIKLGPLVSYEGEEDPLVDNEGTDIPLQFHFLGGGGWGGIDGFHDPLSIFNEAGANVVVIIEPEGIINVDDNSNFDIAAGEAEEFVEGNLVTLYCTRETPGGEPGRDISEDWGENEHKNGVYTLFYLDVDAGVMQLKVVGEEQWAWEETIGELADEPNMCQVGLASPGEVWHDSHRKGSGKYLASVMDASENLSDGDTDTVFKLMGYNINFVAVSDPMEVGDGWGVVWPPAETAEVFNVQHNSTDPRFAPNGWTNQCDAEAVCGSGSNASFPPGSLGEDIYYSTNAHPWFGQNDGHRNFVRVASVNGHAYSKPCSVPSWCLDSGWSVIGGAGTNCCNYYPSYGSNSTVYSSTTGPHGNSSNCSNAASCAWSGIYDNLGAGSWGDGSWNSLEVPDFVNVGPIINIIGAEDSEPISYNYSQLASTGSGSPAYSTMIGDYYMHAETSSPSNRVKWQLETPNLDLSGDLDAKFRFHLHQAGEHAGVFRVELISVAGGTIGENDGTVTAFGGTCFNGEAAWPGFDNDYEQCVTAGENFTWESAAPIRVYANGNLANHDGAGDPDDVTQSANPFLPLTQQFVVDTVSGEYKLRGFDKGDVYIVDPDTGSGTFNVLGFETTTAAGGTYRYGNVTGSVLATTSTSNNARTLFPLESQCLLAGGEWLGDHCELPNGSLDFVDLDNGNTADRGPWRLCEVNLTAFAQLHAVCRVRFIYQSRGPSFSEYSANPVWGPTAGTPWRGDIGIAYPQFLKYTPEDASSTNSVILSSLEGAITNSSSVLISILFESTVIGFNPADIMLENCVLDEPSFTQLSGASYQVNVEPSAQGDFRVYIPAGTVETVFGESNELGELTIIYDTENPEGVIDCPSYDPAAPPGINVSLACNILFNEPVYGFTGDAIIIARPDGSTVAAVGFTETDPNHSWNFTVAASDENVTYDGEWSIHVEGGACMDLAGNPNIVVPTFNFNKDLVKPILTLSSTESGTTSAATIPLEMEWSEPVVGFDIDSFTVLFATLENFTEVDATHYTMDVIPIGGAQIAVQISVVLLADTIDDFSGNSNANGVSWTIYFDALGPTYDSHEFIDVSTGLALAVDSELGIPITNTNGQIALTINFTEPVFGLNHPADLVISSSGSDFSTNFYDFTDDTSHVIKTFTVNTLSEDVGFFSFSIAPGEMQDSFGNLNLLIELEDALYVDWSQPVPVIEVQSGEQPEVMGLWNNVLLLKISFIDLRTGYVDEIFDFDITDLQTLNAVVSGFEEGTCYSGEDVAATSNCSYNFTFAPDADGLAKVWTDAGAGVDFAGNDSLPSNVVEAQVDFTTPSISHISMRYKYPTSSEYENPLIPLSFQFSELLSEDTFGAEKVIIDPNTGSHEGSGTVHQTLSMVHMDTEIGTSNKDGNWVDMAYAEDINGLPRWVVIARDSNTTDTVLWSDDQITWQYASTSWCGEWVSVTYGNGYFVAIASGENAVGCADDNKIMISEDGDTWVKDPGRASYHARALEFGYGFTYCEDENNNPVFANPALRQPLYYQEVCEASGGIWRPDGVSFPMFMSAGGFYAGIAGSVHGQSGVSEGWGWGTEVMWTSDLDNSGATWHFTGDSVSLNITSQVPWNYSGYIAVDMKIMDIAYGNGVWVIVGIPSEVGSTGQTGSGQEIKKQSLYNILTSSNGLEWTIISSPVLMPLCSVVYGGGRFVATALSKESPMLDEGGTIIVNDNWADSFASDALTIMSEDGYEWTIGMTINESNPTWSFENGRTEIRNVSWGNTEAPNPSGFVFTYLSDTSSAYAEWRQRYGAYWSGDSISLTGGGNGNATPVTDYSNQPGIEPDWTKHDTFSLSEQDSQTNWSTTLADIPAGGLLHIREDENNWARFKIIQNIGTYYSSVPADWISHLFTIEHVESSGTHHSTSEDAGTHEIDFYSSYSDSYFLATLNSVDTPSEKHFIFSRDGLSWYAGDAFQTTLPSGEWEDQVVLFGTAYGFILLWNNLTWAGGYGLVLSSQGSSFTASELTLKAFHNAAIDLSFVLPETISYQDLAFNDNSDETALTIINPKEPFTVLAEGKIRKISDDSLLPVNFSDLDVGSEHDWKLYIDLYTDDDFATMVPISRSTNAYPGEVDRTHEIQVEDIELINVPIYYGSMFSVPFWSTQPFGIIDGYKSWRITPTNFGPPGTITLKQPTSPYTTQNVKTGSRGTSIGINLGEVYSYYMHINHNWPDSQPWVKLDGTTDFDMYSWSEYPEEVGVRSNWKYIGESDSIGLIFPSFNDEDEYLDYFAGGNGEFSVFSDNGAANWEIEGWAISADPGTVSVDTERLKLDSGPSQKVITTRVDVEALGLAVGSQYILKDRVKSEGTALERDLYLVLEREQESISPPNSSFDNYTIISEENDEWGDGWTMSSQIDECMEVYLNSDCYGTGNSCIDIVGGPASPCTNTWRIVSAPAAFVSSLIVGETYTFSIWMWAGPMVLPDFGPADGPRWTFSIDAMNEVPDHHDYWEEIPDPLEPINGWVEQTITKVWKEEFNRVDMFFWPQVYYGHVLLSEFTAIHHKAGEQFLESSWAITASTQSDHIPFILPENLIGIRYKLTNVSGILLIEYVKLFFVKYSHMVQIEKVVDTYAEDLETPDYKVVNWKDGRWADYGAGNLSDFLLENEAVYNIAHSSSLDLGTQYFNRTEHYPLEVSVYAGKCLGATGNPPPIVRTRNSCEGYDGTWIDTSYWKLSPEFERIFEYWEEEEAENKVELILHTNKLVDWSSLETDANGEMVSPRDAGQCIANWRLAEGAQDSLCHYHLDNDSSGSGENSLHYDKAGEGFEDHRIVYSPDALFPKISSSADLNCLRHGEEAAWTKLAIDEEGNTVFAIGDNRSKIVSGGITFFALDLSDATANPVTVMYGDYSSHLSTLYGDDVDITFGSAHNDRKGFCNGGTLTDYGTAPINTIQHHTSGPGGHGHRVLFPDFCGAYGGFGAMGYNAGFEEWSSGGAGQNDTFPGWEVSSYEDGMVKADILESHSGGVSLRLDSSSGYREVTRLGTELTAYNYHNNLLPFIVGRSYTFSFWLKWVDTGGALPSDGTLLYFDGNDSYNRVENTCNSTLANATYSFWMKSSNSTENKHIFGHGGTTGGYRLEIEGESQGSTVLVRHGSSEMVKFLDSGEPENGYSSDGLWHHWVVYVDATTRGDCKLWIDGTPMSISSASGVAGNISAYLEGLTIGAYEAGGGDDDSLTGYLSGFAWYDTELSNAEVSSIFNYGREYSQVGNSNLQGYWEWRGTTDDLSGNGNDGVLFGAQYQSSDANLKCRFYPSGQYVTFPPSITPDTWEKVEITRIWGEFDDRVSLISSAVPSPPQWWIDDFEVSEFGDYTMSLGGDITFLKDRSTSLKSHVQIAVNFGNWVEEELDAYRWVPCTDIDGNEYETIKIGNQVWMAENLKTTHYNDGSEIVNIINNGDWGSATEGAYTVYPYDEDADSLAHCGGDCADVFGLLYNAYTIKIGDLEHGGVCPNGFHVPSDDEFKELGLFLGTCEGSIGEENDLTVDSNNPGCIDNRGYIGTDEGSQLAGLTSDDDNTWGGGGLVNNPMFGTSGFNILSSGVRHHNNGSHENMGSYGNLWTSTHTSSTGAPSETGTWKWQIQKTHPLLYRATFQNSQGNGIRCVRGNQGYKVGKHQTPMMFTHGNYSHTNAPYSAWFVDRYDQDVSSDLGTSPLFSSEEFLSLTGIQNMGGSGADATWVAIKSGHGEEAHFYGSDLFLSSTSVTMGSHVMWHENFVTPSGEYPLITNTAVGKFSAVDNDGNVYQTVQIGDQLWMAENLKTTTYNDDTVIPTGHNDVDWVALSIGGFSVYDDDSANVALYGNLYNWYAAANGTAAGAGEGVPDNGGVCPLGFHFPTDEEWKELEMELGMTQSDADTYGAFTPDTIGSNLAGNKWGWDFASNNPTEVVQWNVGNLSADDDFKVGAGFSWYYNSGFIALSAGHRSGSGSYIGIGESAQFWTATHQGGGGGGNSRLLQNADTGRQNAFSSEKLGKSVRCVRTSADSVEPDNNYFVAVASKSNYPLNIIYSCKYDIQHPQLHQTSVDVSTLAPANTSWNDDSNLGVFHDVVWGRTSKGVELFFAIGTEGTHNMQMYSTDGGINWVPASMSFAGAYHLAYVEFGPGNTMFVAAGENPSTPWAHLYTSSDPLDQVSWDMPILADMGDMEIIALAACQSCADGGAPMIVAIAQLNDGTEAKAYKSLDGVNWTWDTLPTPGPYVNAGHCTNEFTYSTLLQLDTTSLNEADCLNEYINGGAGQWQNAIVNNNESDSPLGYVDIVAANHGGYFSDSSINVSFILLANSLTVERGQVGNIIVGSVNTTNEITWTGGSELGYSIPTGDWYRWESDYLDIAVVGVPAIPAKYNVLDTANRRFIRKEVKIEVDLSNCSEEYYVLPFDVLNNIQSPGLIFNRDYLNRWELSYDDVRLISYEDILTSPSIFTDYIVGVDGSIIIIRDTFCEDGGSDCNLQIVFFVDDPNKVYEFEEISSNVYVAAAQIGTDKRYKNTSSVFLEHFEEPSVDLFLQLKEGVIEDFAGSCYDEAQVSSTHIYPSSYEYVNGVTPPTVDGFLPDPTLKPDTYEITSIKISDGNIMVEQNANTIGAATLDEASGRLGLGESYYCDNGTSVNETDCGTASASWVALTGDGSHGPIEITYTFDSYANTTNYLNCPAGYCHGVDQTSLNEADCLNIGLNGGAGQWEVEEAWESAGTNVDTTTSNTLLTTMPD